MNFKVFFFLIILSDKKFIYLFAYKENFKIGVKMFNITFKYQLNYVNNSI